MQDLYGPSTSTTTWDHVSAIQFRLLFSRSFPPLHRQLYTHRQKRKRKKEIERERDFFFAVRLLGLLLFPDGCTLVRRVSTQQEHVLWIRKKGQRPNNFPSFFFLSFLSLCNLGKNNASFSLRNVDAKVYKVIRKTKTKDMH